MAAGKITGFFAALAPGDKRQARECACTASAVGSWAHAPPVRAGHALRAATVSAGAAAAAAAAATKAEQQRQRKRQRAANKAIREGLAKKRTVFAKRLDVHTNKAHRDAYRQFVHLWLALGTRRSPKKVLQMAEAHGLLPLSMVLLLAHYSDTGVFHKRRAKLEEAATSMGMGHFMQQEAPARLGKWSWADLREVPADLLHAALRDGRVSNGAERKLPLASDAAVEELRKVITFKRKSELPLTADIIRRTSAKVFAGLAKDEPDPERRAALCKFAQACASEVAASTFNNWLHTSLGMSWRAGNSKKEKSPVLEVVRRWKAIALAQLRSLSLKLGMNLQMNAVFNTDESCFQLVINSTRTWEWKGSCHNIAMVGSGDKRSLTVTPTITMTGGFMKVQVLGNGLSEDSFKAKIFAGLSEAEKAKADKYLRCQVTGGKKCWQHSGTLRQFTQEVVLPFCERARESMPEAHFVWLLDCASSHVSDDFLNWVEMTCPYLHVLIVPPNMTHLMQPLDLVFQRAIKAHVRRLTNEWIDQMLDEFELTEDGLLAARAAVKDAVRTGKVLPKTFGVFLPQALEKAFAEPEKLTEGWAKTPYWCAMHPPHTWRGDVQDDDEGLDLLKQAYYDPDGFLEQHNATHPRFFVQQMRNRMARVQLHFKDIMPPVADKRLDLSVDEWPLAVLQEHCKRHGIPAGAGPAVLRSKLDKFYDPSISLEYRLDLFSTARLRRLVTSCDILKQDDEDGDDLAKGALVELLACHFEDDMEQWEEVGLQMQDQLDILNMQVVGGVLLVPADEEQYAGRGSAGAAYAVAGAGGGDEHLAADESQGEDAAGAAAL